MLGGGYSAIWLICLYVMGAYFRIYGAPKWAKWFVTLPTFFLAALAAGGLKIVPEMMVKEGTLDKASKWYEMRSGLVSYISPCMVIMSVMLLMFFMQLKIKGKIPKLVITELGRASWGVFVLHVSAAFWDYTKCWRKFYEYGDYPLGKMFFSLIGATVLFYLAMSLISVARFWLFKLCRVNKGVDFLADLPQKLSKKKE